MKETDLFPPVKELFESQGYTVYSEVEGPSGRADVVAVRGPLLVVVELKTSLSLELVIQAVGWEKYAHYRYIAIPERKNGLGWETKDFLQRLGIGLITVSEFTGFGVGTVREARVLPNPKARYLRPKSSSLRNALHEEQRIGPPGGSRGGGYITSYSLTIDRVKTFLLYCGETGASLDEILKTCPTHYISPKQSLYKALTTIEARWCEAFKADGKTRFRHKQNKPEAG